MHKKVYSQRLQPPARFGCERVLPLTLAHTANVFVDVRAIGAIKQ